MRIIARVLAAIGFAAVLGTATTALADFSACESALTTNDTKQQIALYTTCITKGGLGIAERMGAFNNRGDAYQRLGEFDKAFNDFTWAIEADPNWGVSYLNRAGIYARRGEWAKAVADLDKATKLDPVRVRLPAYLEEAVILATCPDPGVRDAHRALGLAQKAVKMSDKALERSTLAMAYASAGQLDDAVREQVKAISLAGKETSPAELADYQSRLDRYRKGIGSAEPQ